MTTRGVVCGRAAERAVLDASVDDLGRGRGSFVLVTGAAGLGKSFLLADACAGSSSVGASVFTAAARELEQTHPFGAFVDALRVARDDPVVADVLALLHADDAAERRYVAHDRLLDVFEAMALAAPLTLVIDDLQWADAATLAVLHRLAELTRELPLLLAVGSRPAPPAERFVPLATNRLELAPLDDAGVAELVALRTGRTAGPRLLDLLTRAGGNPLFVEELLRSLERDTALHDDGAVVECAADSVPTSARQATLSRLAFLSEDALQVLRTSAVLGTTFAVGDVAVVLGRSVSRLVGPIDAELAARYALEASQVTT